jgi:two-component system sensor histidine kinase CreC
MCHAVPGKWCVFGCMLSAGGSFQWFRNQLGHDEVSAARRRKVDPYELLIAEAEKAEPGSEGLFFLPYLTGERCPHPDPSARGGWIGITARTRRREMIRSLLEGITFGMRDALEGKKYVENYVQTLTHEIKSPVAAIRGAAELLQEDMPAAQRDRFMHNILTETIRIQEIVDRLLLLSAVEAMKSLDERKPVDLAEVLRNAIASVEPQAVGKKIRVEARLDDEGCVVEGDRFLLEKSLLNLLQNAVEFSPPGRKVAVALVVNAGWAEIIVEDEGPGIPVYAMEKVFDRFYSLPRPDSGRKSSGLGLSIVREIARLHGGDAKLVNRDGGGARASLTLPKA